MDLNVNIESLLKDQAKKVVAEPYEALIKTFRAIAPKVKGIIWEGPFTPSLDDMPPEYYDLQAKMGEYLKSASMKVEYKGWTVELRSVIPILPEKSYAVKYVVNFDAAKQFSIHMNRNNLLQPDAAQFLMSAFQGFAPGMTKDLTGAFADLRNELLLPTIRTGSVDVDKAYIVRGDNGFLLQEFFSQWQIREFFANEQSPIKSFTLKGAKDPAIKDEPKPSKSNSLWLDAVVNPSDAKWFVQGFETIKMELDILHRLHLINKPLTLSDGLA
jgi:hypothetical protein